ncbi:MAG: hypothetical protein BGO07_00610 [Alphaproteobacteria bacterium 40-19]|nr:MAG: hypothetical protein BGO07_00610 [Alphaproteobacteria bacterium 40-19]
MKKNILFLFLFIQFFETAEALENKSVELLDNKVNDINQAKKREYLVKAAPILNHMQGDTLKKLAQYIGDMDQDNDGEVDFYSDSLSTEQYEQMKRFKTNVAETFGSSGGECFGFVYTWFTQDILNSKKKFTEFIDFLKKWDKNYKTMPKKEHQVIDQMLQRIRLAQAYQNGDRSSQYNEHLKGFFIEGEQGKGAMKDLHIDDLLADSGLFRRRLVEKVPLIDLQNNFQKALGGQDKCMLAIEVYGDRGGHAMGVYQEKDGGPILFYDPNFDIQTAKNAEDLAYKVMNAAGLVNCFKAHNIDRLIDVEASGAQIQPYHMDLYTSGDKLYSYWGEHSKKNVTHPFNVLRSIMENMGVGDSLYLTPKGVKQGVGLIWSRLGTGEYSVQYEGLDGQKEQFSCKNEDDQNKMFVKIVNYMKEIENKGTEWDNFIAMPAKANPLLARLSVNASHLRASDSSEKEVKNSSSEGDKKVLPSSVKSEVKPSENAQAELPKDKKSTESASWGLDWFKGISLEDYSDKALRATATVIKNFIALGKWWYTNPKELAEKVDSVLPDILIQRLIEFLQKSSNPKDIELLKFLLTLPVAHK